MLSESAKSEIKRLIALYPRGRSALVPALYVAQREVGWLPPEAQADVAELLNLDPCEVGAVVGFYEMLHEHPLGKHHIQVCTNVPCMLRGAHDCLKHFEERLGIKAGETTADGEFTLDHMECLGSCGTAPMAMVHERYFENLTPERIDNLISDLHAGKITPGDITQKTQDLVPEGLHPGTYGGKVGANGELYFLGKVNIPDQRKIDVAAKGGAYTTAQKVLTTMQPAQVVDEVKASGVRGRGGAGFPAGQKWSFLPKGAYPRYLVVNADESEPGTFKDRMLMEYDPHQLIEGMIISAFACEANMAFIYIRGEYAYAMAVLKEAVAEAYSRGYLGKAVFGTNFSFDIVVHPGAGAYICGEETTLLSSLEGYRGHPRLKPPFPAVAGLYAKPTVVNNVETICSVVHIMKYGANWFKGFGTEKNPGFRIFCLCGAVKKPGLYELPHGITLRSLIDDWGGGTLDDKPVKAVVPGGLSMKLLSPDQLDTPLDNDSVAAAGSLLGSAGVIVITEGTSMIDIAERTLAFYREESCGKCTPCREGTPWLEKILHRINEGHGRTEDIDVMLRLTNSMVGGRAFCPFAEAAVWGLQSNIAKYRQEFDQYIKASNPQDADPEIPIRPIYRPNYGEKVPAPPEFHKVKPS